MFVSVMLSCLFLATLWSSAGERANLLAFLCVMCPFGFVTSSFGVPGQVRYLIDIDLLRYFRKRI